MTLKKKRVWLLKENVVILYKVFLIFNFIFMNIFIAKLDFDTQEAGLKKAFEVFGEVSSVKIIKDKFSGRSKGFGFIEMPVEEEAQSAINELNDSELDGRTIVVKKAKPKENNSHDNRSGNSDYNRY